MVLIMYFITYFYQNILFYFIVFHPRNYLCTGLLYQNKADIPHLHSKIHNTHFDNTEYNYKSLSGLLFN